MLHLNFNSLVGISTLKSRPGELKRVKFLVVQASRERDVEGAEHKKIYKEKKENIMQQPKKKK
jgi:hypothetical protein